MRFMWIVATSGIALAQLTSPTGFGRNLYPGTGGPGVSRGPGSVSTGGAGFGRNIYPGTGAPYVVRPSGGPVVGRPGGRPNYTLPPTVPHQTHGRSAIVSYPIFWGGYYSNIDVPQAGAYDDRDHPPVVIINEAYRPETPNPVMLDYANTPLPQAAVRDPRPVTPRDPHAEDPTLYQIAMTDGAIFEAVGHWLEGGVLHYLTLEGTHNQATLELGDRERTQKLNVD